MADFKKVIGDEEYAHIMTHHMYRWDDDYPKKSKIWLYIYYIVNKSKTFWNKKTKKKKEAVAATINIIRGWPVLSLNYVKHDMNWHGLWYQSRIHQDSQLICNSMLNKLCNNKLHKVMPCPKGQRKSLPELQTRKPYLDCVEFHKLL